MCSAARFLVVFVPLISLGLGGCLTSESPAVGNVHTVIPGVLVRGGQPGKSGLRALRDEFGVKTVVNFNDLTNKSEAKACAELGLNYLPLRDDPFNDADNQDLLVSFLKVLRERDRYGNVYVHCKTGMDRTGTAIGTYRIVECNWTAEQAIAEQARYQNAVHGFFFPGTPGYLRGVERDRNRWLELLEGAPDPAVVVPAGSPKQGVKSTDAAAPPPS
jgi:protein tyrosine/serine phosphatase